MMLKNYLDIDTNNIELMKSIGSEIATEIAGLPREYTLGRLGRRALIDLEKAINTTQVKNSVTVIIQKYYTAKAGEWLDAGNELPAEYDEWNEIIHATKAHMLETIGVKVFKGNGWMAVYNMPIEI